MGFNDDIIKLTGGKGFADIGFANGKSKKEKPNNDASNDSKPVESKEEEQSLDTSWAGDYVKSDQDYVIESDLVVPTIQAVRDETIKPLVVVVDDDFEALDLIEIYLKRDYTYEGFHGPRDAIYFLNKHVPEIIFLDCKIHTMKALTFAEIVRTGKGNENVKFVLLGEESELASFDLDTLPDYFVGKIKKPIARGEFVAYIEKAIEENKKAKSGE